MYPRYNLKADNIRVIDGDTLQCDIYFPEESIIIRERLRLNYVDAPEVSTIEGLEIKYWLTEYIQNKIVTVDLLGKDKYGRFLANIHIDNESLSETLLRKFTSVKKYVCGVARTLTHVD
jgi:micrococcal nuclease